MARCQSIPHSGSVSPGRAHGPDPGMTVIRSTGKGIPMIRKLVKVSIAAAIAVLAVVQWPEVRRYAALKRMSHGQGHPENVPMRGTQAYPKHAGDGAQD